MYRIFLDCTITDKNPLRSILVEHVTALKPTAFLCCFTLSFSFVHWYRIHRVLFRKTSPMLLNSHRKCPKYYQNQVHFGSHLEILIWVVPMPNRVTRSAPRVSAWYANFSRARVFFMLTLRSDEIQLRLHEP